MKLQDIINADFANLIYEYKDIELQEFYNGTLTIKCVDGIQASNLVLDLELDYDTKISTMYDVFGKLVYFITIK